MPFGRAKTEQRCDATVCSRTRTAARSAAVGVAGTATVVPGAGPVVLLVLFVADGPGGATVVGAADEIGAVDGVAWDVLLLHAPRIATATIATHAFGRIDGGYDPSL